MKRQGTTTRTPAQFCPACFSLLSAASSLKNDVVPAPGDFSICVYCAAVLRFDDGMMLTPSSLLHIPPHSRKAFAEAVQLIEARKRREQL